MQEPDGELDPRTPGSCPELKADVQPSLNEAESPRRPDSIFLKSDLLKNNYNGLNTVSLKSI